MIRKLIASLFVLILLCLSQFACAGIENTVWKFLYQPDHSYFYHNGYRDGEVYLIDMEENLASSFRNCPNCIAFYSGNYAFTSQFFWDSGAGVHAFFYGKRGVAIQINYLYVIPIVFFWNLELEGTFDEFGFDII